FSADINVACEAPFTVNFDNQSNNGSSYLWSFGDGQTSTDVHPTHTYTSVGNYTVSLFVDGGNCGTETDSIVDFVSINPNNPCTGLMPTNGSQTLTWCTGTLYDSGGPSSNYADNTDVTTTISPVGATSVTLNFSSFGYEETYDYIYLYDGPTTASPLIGQYDGFALPNGGTVTSTGGAITIRQTSDIMVSESGFALTWECEQPTSAPTANFVGGPTISCSGLVSFSDLSINGATGWLWSFGDGNTSADQNPTHTYASEGTYTVSLTASNNYGSDVISQTNYIVVNKPDGPPASDGFLCSAGSVNLSASGQGTLQWYSEQTGGNALATGPAFNTPNLATTTTYYVEDAVLPAPYNVGPSDNSFGGGDNFQGDQYLVFDCVEAFTINTVKVYAQGEGNRTIELRDDNGNVLQSATINIPDGEQTVALGFAVQPGVNYQLGTTPDPDLYRNNENPTFPYTVPNVVSITSSSAGNDFYYFFYDWQITTPGCISKRTAVVANIASSPSVVDASRCVSLSASGDGDLNWFDDATSGNLVNTGTSFNTPSISATTSYFVESEIGPAPQFGGATDNSFGTGGDFNNIQSLLFDCFEEITLVSVKVYATGSG
ncbi:MAG: PKD domain-containing protein, partial [Flavobacteriales bacterium]